MSSSEASSEQEESDISDAEEWEEDKGKLICKLHNILALPQLTLCNEQFTTKQNLDFHRLRIHNREQLTFYSSGPSGKRRRQVDKPASKKWEKLEHALTAGGLGDKHFEKLKKQKKADLEDQYKNISDEILRVTKILKDLKIWEATWRNEMDLGGHIQRERKKRAQARSERLNGVIAKRDEKKKRREVASKKKQTQAKRARRGRPEKHMDDVNDDENLLTSFQHVLDAGAYLAETKNQVTIGPQLLDVGTITEKEHEAGQASLRPTRTCVSRRMEKEKEKAHEEKQAKAARHARRENFLKLG